MRKSRSTSRSKDKDVASPPRIIGGELRGRTIPYNGDAGLRPMKDRVRESLFNLIGPDVVDKTVLDLFAGTGALSFESLSRRARQAIVIERRFPNARLIEETAATFGLADRVKVIAGDAFKWGLPLASQAPSAWLVFCSPPYEFYVTRHDELLNLLKSLWDQAPEGSCFAVESDERFNMGELPDAEQWDVRHYPPAVLAIARKRAASLIDSGGQ